MILREKASYGSSKFTDCGGQEFQHSKQLFLQNSDLVFQVSSFDEFSTFVESSKDRNEDFLKSPFSLSKHFHFFVSPLKKIVRVRRDVRRFSLTTRRPTKVRAKLEVGTTKARSFPGLRPNSAAGFRPEVSGKSFLRVLTHRRRRSGMRD